MIIYLDTETSGLYPGQICQLSYIMQDADKTVAKNMFFTVDEVEYGAYAVHGFSEEKLKVLSGGKTFKDRIDEIEKDLNGATCIVAHNSAFDFMFLRKEFERTGREFLPKNEFCSMKKMTPVCRIRKSYGNGYKYPKLSELMRYFGISDQTVSSAMAELFGVGGDFHDARFDTSALYYCMNFGMDIEETLMPLKEFL